MFGENVLINKISLVKKFIFLRKIKHFMSRLIRRVLETERSISQLKRRKEIVPIEKLSQVHKLSKKLHHSCVSTVFKLAIFHQC